MNDSVRLKTKQSTMQYASLPCLELIAMLAMAPKEAANWIQEWEGMDGSLLKRGHLYQRIAFVLRENERACRSLNKNFSAGFEILHNEIRSMSMIELTIWWRRNWQTAEKPVLAAFLIKLAQKPQPWFRKLEKIVVDDIRILSVQALCS